MKKKFFGLFLSLLLVVSLAANVYAATETRKTAELIIRDIKIILNGKAIQPKDATGKEVEPFIIDGTTYLPVRAVANALGLDVGWDDATSTVTLSNPNLVLDGKTLVDNEYATITLTSEPYKASYGDYYYIDASVYNKTNNLLCISAERGAVNSEMTLVMIDGSAILNPGTKSDISFWFEKEDISSAEEIKNVQVTLSGWDWDTYETYFSSGILNISY